MRSWARATRRCMISAVNKESHMRTPNIKKNAVPLLIILFLVQFAVLGLAYSSLRSDNQALRSDQEALGKDVDLMQTQVRAATAAASQSHVVVSLDDNTVAIPELRVKLPLNAVTTQLTYTVRTPYMPNSNNVAEADISTIALASFPLPSQPIGCSTSVRVKIEDKPNPYNPHETVRASVKLADGRTLQAYSYQHDTCDQAFTGTGTDSVGQAEAFREARSY